MKDYEQNYEEFWKEIVEKDGNLDLDQIKRELFDFHRLIQNVPKVYDHVTGGAVTKPLTDPSIVCELADEHYELFHYQGFAE